MTEQNWKPLFRIADASVTKVLHSTAFRHSRERSGTIIENAAQLRRLAASVESLDYADAPLSAVADHVAAAVRFLRAVAHRLDVRPSPDDADAGNSERQAEGVHAGASAAARQRLIVAALDYLVTRDDLVPDFRPGGYVDDVLAMTWVFGAAEHELEPYLDDPPLSQSAE